MLEYVSTSDPHCAIRGFTNSYETRIRIDDALRELEQRASRLEGDSGHWATKAEIAALRGELNTVKAELHGQIKSLESGLSSRLSTLMWCAGAGVSIVGVTVGILARILIPG